MDFAVPHRMNIASDPAPEQARVSSSHDSAILCSDVVGFSWLAGADEDRNLARLRVHPFDG
jgi:class 3 adenylate cyclase